MKREPIKLKLVSNKKIGEASPNEGRNGRRGTRMPRPVDAISAAAMNEIRKQLGFPGVEEPPPPAPPHPDSMSKPTRILQRDIEAGKRYFDEKQRTQRPPGQWYKKPR